MLATAVDAAAPAAYDAVVANGGRGHHEGADDGVIKNANKESERNHNGYDKNR